MLSFEEFKAANNRDKNSKLRSIGQLSDNKNPPKPNKSALLKDQLKQETNEKKFSSSLPDFGSFLEMTQLQIFIIVMVLFDTFASFLETYMLLISHQSAIGAGSPEQESLVNSIYFRYSFIIISGFSGFSLYLFALEILAIIIVFRSSVIFHIGYMLDSVVIAIQLYVEILHIGKIARLLNFLRLWRIIRLISKFIEKEKFNTQTAMEEQEKHLLELTQLQIEYKQCQNNILKEKAAKKAVEDMLKGYKEEIDTLNEALKIAAMDIAEIGGQNFDDFESDSDIDEGSAGHVDEMNVNLLIPKTKKIATGDQSSFEENPSGGITESKTGTDTDYINTTTNNSVDNPKKRVSNAGNNNSNSTADITFVINEDGSYQKKKY